MSTVHIEDTQTEAVLQPLGIDQARGKQAIRLFIGSEIFLFIMLFFSYFFLSNGDWRWTQYEPPKMTLSIVMLVVLLASSVILRWGEKRVDEGSFALGRAALAVTVLLGVAFLVLSAFDYRDHLKHLTPQMNAYGSTFYTITTSHVAHLILGLLMLGYVLVLPEVGRTDRPPHRAYADAALYWHFVDVVWVFIVGLLYVLPNLR